MFTVDYSLIRSKRKTAAIYVRDGGVEVRAPLKMPRADIDRFVASKEKWITDKLTAVRIRTESRESFSLTYGDSVIYRGKECTIAARDGNRIGFEATAFYMPPDLTPDQIRYACVQIYRILAKRDLTAKTLSFAGLMNLKPSEKDKQR